MFGCCKALGEQGASQLMLMMLVCWGGCKVFASRQNFPADADDAGLSKVPADAHCDCLASKTYWASKVPADAHDARPLGCGVFASQQHLPADANDALTLGDVKAGWTSRVSADAHDARPFGLRGFC